MTQPQQAAPSSGYDATGAPPEIGRFVWHDLMTSDGPAAIAFYTALYGWTTRTLPMGEFGDYTMLHAGEQAIGGIVPMRPADDNPPSHWIGYATVPSVDAACAAVEGLGGSVQVPPTDIPDVGRFAVVADPTGATISPFTAPDGAAAPADEPDAFGVFCWDELMSPDPEASTRFHAGLFGWRWESMDMGPLGVYHLAHRGPVPAAGLMRLPDEAQAGGARSHWLPYVHVPDVDASYARATELGARPMVSPRDIPGIGRFAVFMDPTGAVCASYRPAPRG